MRSRLPRADGSVTSRMPSDSMFVSVLVPMVLTVSPSTAEPPLPCCSHNVLPSAGAERRGRRMVDSSTTATRFESTVSPNCSRRTRFTAAATATSSEPGSSVRRSVPAPPGRPSGAISASATPATALSAVTMFPAATPGPPSPTSASVAAKRPGAAVRSPGFARPAYQPVAFRSFLAASTLARSAAIRSTTEPAVGASPGVSTTSWPSTLASMSDSRASR